MLSQRIVETFVGFFLLLALIALGVMAFKVSGLTTLFPPKTYTVIASFDDVGGLKVRAPVKMSGVQIGEVSRIYLDPKTFKATVKMEIRNKFDNIPDDSSAGIYTSGLLGDNYIAISPMYNETPLQNGSEIQITHSAVVLEKLIGQFIYNIGNSGNSESHSKVTNTQQIDDINNQKSTQEKTNPNSQGVI